jgi:chitin deacetylase
LFAALVLIATYRLHRSRTTQLFGELVTSIETTDSVVAITFDDGPSAYTDSILSQLRHEQISATFFVIGSAVARHPEVARRIVQEGHELGNHSYSHDRMVLMSMRTIRREVELTDSLIRAAGGSHRSPFRPPYGKRLVGLPWYLWRTNRPTVLWTLEPDSWFHDQEAIAKNVRELVRPGSIILLHVEVPARVEERAALGPIIRDLKQRGYKFVTVSELLALKQN